MTITKRIYDALLDKNAYSGDESMWVERPDKYVGPHYVATYSSGWMRKP